MKKSEAKEIVMLLATHNSVPAWSEDKIKLFMMLIEDLDREAARQAAIDWMKTHPVTECPSPSDIRKLLVERSAPDLFLSVDEAWAYVEECVRKVGSYKAFPKDTYPLVARAVASMGWVAICRSENEMADRAHFFKLYGAMLERAKNESAATHGARGDLPSLPAERVERLLESQQKITTSSIAGLVEKVLKE